MRPPGFQDAAVASSATAINAPPIPWARAPEPTGFGDELIWTLVKIWPYVTGMHIKHKGIAIINIKNRFFKKPSFPISFLYKKVFIFINNAIPAKQGGLKYINLPLLAKGDFYITLFEVNFIWYLYALYYTAGIVKL